MTGQKLAVVAAALAGGAVLTWTIVETLRDPGPEQRTTTEAAGDSISRLVARVAPSHRAPGVRDWDALSRGDARWEDWSRAAAELRVRGSLAADLGGASGDRRGRSFWDGDGDFDAARGTPGPRSARVAAIAMRKREPLVSGRTYRAPAAGRRVILASGHRIEPPRLNLPDTASVGIALGARARVPVRVEVCVSKEGRPAEARVMEGTGVTAVDGYVARQMLAGRYRPLLQNGRPVEFCERSTIILRRSQTVQVVRPPSECGPDC